jgi:glycosyltransferase involved in cell wall biosynthesis
VWGIRLEEVIRPHPRPFKVVLASLGMCDFTRTVMESSDLADGVVAVSQVAMDVIPRAHQRRTALIPTAVDLDRVVPRRPVTEVRARWGLEEGNKALVFLGRIAPEKNPLAVARTIAALHRMGRTEWRGILVGPGTPPKYVTVAYIDDTIGVSEDMAPGLVRFIGFATDIGSVYAAADHMIVPSLVEGGSLSLLEMWAAGKPVLATPVGMVAHEHPDLVRQIPIRGKGHEMAQALVADLEDPEGTRARVERARQIVRERYTVEALGQRWTRYLVELAARP